MTALLLASLLPLTLTTPPPTTPPTPPPPIVTEPTLHDAAPCTGFTSIRAMVCQRRQYARGLRPSWRGGLAKDLCAVFRGGEKRTCLQAYLSPH